MAALVFLLLLSSGLILTEGSNLFTDEPIEPVVYGEGSGLADHTDHTIDAVESVGTPGDNWQSGSTLDDLKRNLGSAMRLRGKKNMGAALKWRGKKNMGSVMRLGSRKPTASAVRWRSKKNMGSAMRLRSKKNLASAMRLRTRRHIGMQWRWPQVPSRLMRRSFSADYPEFHSPPSDYSDEDYDEAVVQALERRLARQLRKRYLGSVMRFRSLAGSGFYQSGKPRQWEYDD